MKLYIDNYIKFKKIIEEIKLFDKEEFEIENKNFLILDFETSDNNNEVVEMGAIQFKVQNNLLIVEKIIQRFFSIKSKDSFNYTKVKKKDIKNKIKFQNKSNIDFLRKLITGRSIIVHNGHLEKKIIDKYIDNCQYSSILDIKNFKSFNYKNIKKIEQYAKKCEYLDFSNFPDQFHYALFDCLVIFQIF